MTQISVYFDDSGTHRESSIAVAACYVSTAELWERFRADWRRIMEEEAFSCFHMADFASRSGEFSGWDEEKRRRVLRKLCATINIRIRSGFVGAVNKRDYDDLVSGEFRRYCGSFHYTYAVRTCATAIGLWRRQFEGSGTLRYVFDRMGANSGKGEIMRVMDEARKTSKREALGTGVIVLGGYSFEDKKDFLPLQAADILAWAGFQYARFFWSKRPLNYVAEESLKILLSAPVKRCFQTREELSRWVNAENEALRRKPRHRGEPGEVYRERRKKL